MSHLPTERLAALADDAPTLAETVHLAACPPCAREMAAYTRLLSLSRETREVRTVPLVGWEAVARPLLADGTLAAPRRARLTSRVAAAAALLFAAGLAAGRYSAPTRAAIAPTSPTAATVAGTAGGPSSSGIAFASVNDARMALVAHALGYEAAARYIAVNDSTPQPIAPDAVRSRLAALDEVAARTHEALREAPYDALINRSYLTAQREREATIRQLGEALPVGYRLARY